MTVMGAEAARPARARPTTREAALWAKAEGKVKTGAEEAFRHVFVLNLESGD